MELEIKRLIVAVVLAMVVIVSMIGVRGLGGCHSHGDLNHCHSGQ